MTALAGGAPTSPSVVAANNAGSSRRYVLRPLMDSPRLGAAPVLHRRTMPSQPRCPTQLPKGRCPTGRSHDECEQTLNSLSSPLPVGREGVNPIGVLKSPPRPPA